MAPTFVLSAQCVPGETGENDDYFGFSSNEIEQKVSF